MTWVDTHCHLQLDSRDPGELIAAAPEVAWIVVPGIDADSSQQALELASRWPNRLVATAGLHPHEAERWPAESDRITELAAGAAAVGETGLDYYRDLADRAAQREAFSAHLELARDLGKPVVVHCRDAFADVYDLVAGSGHAGSVVLHSWTGGPRWTRRFAELGVTFSYAGPVAFETGDTVRLGAEQVDPERALVETDTPYLAPPPHRGEPNQPAWVALVGAALAEVWGIDTAEVARLTTRRAEAVFGGPGR